jgi:hypothetical protein
LGAGLHTPLVLSRLVAPIQPHGSINLTKVFYLCKEYSVSHRVLRPPKVYRLNEFPFVSDDEGEIYPAQREGPETSISLSKMIMMIILYLIVSGRFMAARNLLTWIMFVWPNGASFSKCQGMEL